MKLSDTVVLIFLKIEASYIHRIPPELPKDSLQTFGGDGGVWLLVVKVVVVRWCCGCGDCGGGVAVAATVVWWCWCGGCLVVVTVLMTCRQVESLVGDTEIVPFTYRLGDFEIQFGREEFYLDGKLITDGMLLQKIKREEFDTMNGHDVVGLYLLEVLELVLLGHEIRYTVPDWCFRLVNNIKAWNMYPWGSYVWPTLYEQLRDAIRKRWEAHFVTERELDSGPPTYSLMGFTWPLSVILEHLLGVSKEVNVLVILKGARPRSRLTPDAVEARADWWIASKAFFDGDIHESPPIPPLVNQHSRDDVSEYIYRHMVEHDNLLKAHDEKIKSHDILIKQMYDDWQGFPQVGPRIFTPPSSSFFDGIRTSTSQFNKPIFDQPMPSPYLTLFPSTPHTAAPRAQQGFAPWSPYTHLPPTTVVPQKRAEKSKKKTSTANIFAFDLGKAIGDDNARYDDVRITGARTTGDFISYENVDPSKVKRLKYVECLTFLYNPEPIYPDWRDPAKRGWLSDDQINAWMELLIGSRPDGARWTAAKSGIASLNPGSEIFLLETNRVLRGTWDVVDWVYMAIHAIGDHWVTGVINLQNSTFMVLDSLTSDSRKSNLRKYISAWKKVLNDILEHRGHFQTTGRRRYNFKYLYNEAPFPTLQQGNLADYGVVTCWLIDQLCRNRIIVVEGHPETFFSGIRVDMAFQFYQCRCENTSECGYD
ncbi:phospholipase-like protein [Tanacetum coccineum]